MGIIQTIKQIFSLKKARHKLQKHLHGHVVGTQIEKHATIQLERAPQLLTVIPEIEISATGFEYDFSLQELATEDEKNSTKALRAAHSGQFTGRTTISEPADCAKTDTSNYSTAFELNARYLYNDSNGMDSTVPILKSSNNLSDGQQMSVQTEQSSLCLTPDAQILSLDNAHEPSNHEKKPLPVAVNSNGCTPIRLEATTPLSSPQVDSPKSTLATLSRYNSQSPGTSTDGNKPENSTSFDENHVLATPSSGMWLRSHMHTKQDLASRSSKANRPADVEKISNILVKHEADNENNQKNHEDLAGTSQKYHSISTAEAHTLKDKAILQAPADHNAGPHINVQNHPNEIDRAGSPKYSYQPLRSKKECVMAKLRQECTNLSAELAKSRMENEDLHHCIQCNLEYVTNQQKLVHQMQTRLDKLESSNTQLKTRNAELEEENQQLALRSYSTRYNHRMTEVVLQQYYDMFRELNL